MFLNGQVIAAEARQNGIRKTARKYAGLNETGAISATDFTKLIPIMIVILVVIILFTIIPQVSLMVESAFNQTLTGTAWADAPTGAAIWESTSGIITAVIAILLIAIIIGALVSLWKGKKGNGF